MDEVDNFLAELDRQKSMPDEDIDAYIQMRLRASREKLKRSTQNRVNTSEHIPVRFRGDGPYTPLEGASHAVTNPQQQSLVSKVAGEAASAEKIDAGTHPNPAFLGFLPGPSSTGLHSSLVFTPFPKRHTTEITTSAATRCAKRSRTEGKCCIPEEIDCSLRPTPREGVIQDEYTSGIATRMDDAAEKLFSETSISQRVPLHTNSQINGLAPQNDGSPKIHSEQQQIAHTTGLAVPLTEGAPGYSTHADTPEFPLSSPRFSSRHNAPICCSTTSDGHGMNTPESIRKSPHTLLEDGVSEVSPIVAVRPMTVIPSPPRLSSHEANCIGEGSRPRTPAGFNTAAHADTTNVTSPGDISPRQIHNSSGDPHISSSVRPSSSTRKGQGARKVANKNSRTRKVSSSDGRVSKKVKGKSKLITPLEYAQRLQSCLDPHVKPKTNYLNGKRIFYVGGDMMYASTMTRGRMEYIVKHGGTLVPTYDPTNVTHIVTDAGVRNTLRALSLKTLSDIPNHIPTVTWDWVVSGYGRQRERKSDDGQKNEVDDGNNGDRNLDFEFMHAAFPERIDAGCDWKKKPKGKHGRKAAGHLVRADDSQDGSGDVSHISTFSQGGGSAGREGRGRSITVLPPPPLDFQCIDARAPEGGKKAAEIADPLSEYYAQARAEREAQWNRDASDSDDEDHDLEFRREQLPRRGFTCDIKGKPTACVNQHIVDKLEELRELHRAKPSEDDRWRTYSYGKCIPAIRNYPKPIKSFSEARSIRGVGEKTALKIMEIVNTGDLKRIMYEDTEDVKATRIFQGIYGVGRHIAFTWFASGLRTLDDVRNRKGGLTLSSAQEIGLKYYDDINSRMPREEARRIFEMIKPIALAIDGKLFIEIMGSYRRGKLDCGDIDILITRPTADGKTHQGVLHTLLEQLDAAGIVTEDLAVPDDFADLELIYRGLCKLPESGAKRRRIDFLCVPWQSRGAALLYYTGDDIFNRAMRLKARKHGYSLNQRGLYAGVIRDPQDREKKISEGHIIASETEEEIFKILGVPWQEPHERVRG